MNKLLADYYVYHELFNILQINIILSYCWFWANIFPYLLS
jgi:hypothetical protein